MKDNPKMNQTATTASDTFLYTKAATHLQCAEIYVQNIIGTKKLVKDNKITIDRIHNRIVHAKSEYQSIFPDTMKAALKQHVMNDESALQLETVIDMFIALPKGMRDQAEKYMEGLYNVYALNPAQ